MRPDMKRIAIDTGRHNSPWDEEDLSYKGNPEEHPHTGRKCDRKSKSFGDRTQPLYRHLEKSVGKNWDKIWSDICSKNDIRSTDGHHLRTHVLGMVDMKVAVENERYVKIDGFGRISSYALAYGFFVDPKTKQLRSWEKYNKKLIQKRKRETEEKRKAKNAGSATINGERYKKINGCWFHLFIIEYITSSWNWRTEKYDNIKTTQEKQRQLNANELRDLKLQNDNS